MSETIEHAREGIEHAAHAHSHGDEAARWIAVLVAVLAALLAIGEVVEKNAMETWLASHISVSDDYAYYQAKTLRNAVLENQAAVLSSLPNHDDPAIVKLLADGRKQIAANTDKPGGHGMKQLIVQAEHDSRASEHARHKTHEMELVVGGLQIAIVLASVSVVTRMRWLAWAAFAVGLAMAGCGGIVWVGVL